MFVLLWMLALLRETKERAAEQGEQRNCAVVGEPDQVQQEKGTLTSPCRGQREHSQHCHPPKGSLKARGSIRHHPELSPWTTLKPRLGEEPSWELWGSGKRMAHPSSPQPPPTPQ